MNLYHGIESITLWHVAGWTMVHFLWLGALVGIAAAALRLVLRRASPNSRYVAAFTGLAILAALPLFIAGWLMQDPKTNVRLESSIAARGTVDRFTPRDMLNSESNEASNNSTAARSQAAPAAPGSAGGLADGGEQFAGLNPRQSRGLPGELRTPRFASIVRWLESCIVYLPWIWFVGTPLTLALLATGIVGTSRLRRASHAIAEGPFTEMAVRLAKSLRVGRRVIIATCDRVGAPLLVGILRPMILLPPAALTGWAPDEIEMVLLHELAHVRRWDNLVNLLQRLVESLLFFHPAVWLMSSWMRRDREACCDAVVVNYSNRPHAYAELLVALAAQMPRSVLFHPAASSAMAANPLRNRIRRILQLEDDSMLVTGKSFALVLAGLLTAATLAVLYLPARGQAEEAAAEVPEDTETSEEKVDFKASQRRAATSDLEARSLKKLQDEIRKKWDDYLEIAEDGAGRDTKTDLLISDISHLRKQKSELEKQLFQLRNDFLINKSQLEDPQLIDLQVEEALAEDTQYMLLKQQLMELQMAQKRMSSKDRSSRARDANAIDQQVAQINAQIQQYKAEMKPQIERDRRTKPNLMLQQLQKEFQTNAQFAQLQLAGINKVLEEAMDALSKRQTISTDLEQRALELKQLQEIANDMSAKLATPEHSEEDAEPADVAEDAGENETRIDGPTDEAAPDAEDDWLRAADFASEKEHEIAQRAWKELGIKAVPLTEAELEEVRRGGFRGGLKLIGLEEEMNTQGPLILTHIQSKRLATGIGDYASLERAVDALASQPPDELLVLQGIKPRGGIFQYSMRRPQEKSTQSTIADAPETDAQAKSEPVDSEVDPEPHGRVEVEQVRVGDENVTVVRGSQDDVNAFVNVIDGDENRERQNQRRVLGTFSSDSDGLEQLLRAVDEARGQNLYVDIIKKGTEWSLVVVPEPTEADWPAMLGDPPRKNRVITDKAWLRLGLKVVPASELESFEFLSRGLAGGPVKIIGGNVPDGLPLPAFLRRIGGNSLDTFDDLHTWLINEEDKRPQPVKVYAFANGHEYLFEAGPVDEVKAAPAQGPVAKFPSLEDQKLADLAWQMLQLELEPAAKDELKHVRVLGYQGGVTVTGIPRSDGRRVSYNEIQPGDILVGLHVWPTTSLKDVTSILTRDDLADLNPLKFYVVRAEGLVITGRISIRSRGTPSGLSQLDEVERGRKNSTASDGDLSPYIRQSGGEPPAVSENEIKVLQEHIKTLQSQFDRIDALFKAGRRGGHASTRALAAYELAVAKGELALMQGQRAEAVKSFHKALSHAQDAYKAMSADYEAGNTTYDVMLLTSKNLAEIRRKIIQLEQERTAPNRADAAGAGPATSFAAPEAGGPANPLATSGAPEPNPSSAPNKRRDAGVTISAESQEALDEFMRLASSPQPGESISVLTKIVDREKQKYDYMAELAKNGKVTSAEAETQKANYEISIERLRQAERALRYHQALVELHAAEYESALESNKLAPKSISESELRKLQLKVQLAKAKYQELAE